MVEQVRDGSTLRITLPPTFDENYYSILLHLTGVACPTIKRITEEGTQHTHAIHRSHHTNGAESFSCS